MKPSMNYSSYIESSPQSTLSGSLQVTSHTLTTPFLVMDVAVGVIGTVVNGLTLYSTVLLANKGKSAFIVSQLVCDLMSCIFMVATFTWKLAQVKLLGNIHKIFCLLLGSEACMWVCLNSSVTNLVFISIERYVLVKYPLWHRNNQRKWTWISIGCIVLLWIEATLKNIPTTWISTDFSDNRCRAFSQWPSKKDGTAFSIYYTSGVYVVPIIVFIFCYASIIMTMRKSGKVEPGIKDDSKIGPDKSQLTILKAMITITLIFVIFWFPESVYFILVNIECCKDLGIDTKEWSIVLFIGMSTSCINPFIYGLKSNAIKMFYKKFMK